MLPTMHCCLLSNQCPVLSNFVNFHLSQSDVWTLLYLQSAAPLVFTHLHPLSLSRTLSHPLHFLFPYKLIQSPQLSLSLSPPAYLLHSLLPFSFHLVPSLVLFFFFLFLTLFYYKTHIQNLTNHTHRQRNLLKMKKILGFI